MALFYRCRPMGFRRAVWWSAGLVCVLLGMPAMSRAATPTSVKDVDGRTVNPFESAQGARATVLLFTSVDCPISNRYAPVISALDATFRKEGVRFWLVYPNPFETPAAIRDHLRAFSYTLPALLDPDHILVGRARATVTPEAAVFDRDGRETYHGRIDDRYVSLAVERPSPTRHDLEDAITATLAGKPVVSPSAQAVGCFIADFVR